MSKLTKLIKTPGAFFRDRKTNQETARLLSSDSDLDVIQRALNDVAPLDWEALDVRRVFRAFLIPHFGMIEAPSQTAHSLTIGILAEERMRLLKALLLLSARLPFHVSFTTGNVEHPLAHRSLHEAYSLLSAESKWTLSFRIDRDRVPSPSNASSELPLSADHRKLLDAFLADMVRAGDPPVDAHSLFAEDIPGCQTVMIHIWQEIDGFYQTKQPNLVARRIPVKLGKELGLFKRGVASTLHSVHPCAVDTCTTFPVDFVYTWVNDQDPSWRELFRGHAPKAKQASLDATSLDRFLNRDELRYSLRSVARFAPWVRNIFIVTNCAPPPWLDLDHEEIKFIDHQAIFDPDELPTFNSHAIEARLHRIPDLATHFVYFNDDMFLGRPVAKEEFFLSNGVSASILEDYGIVVGPPNPKDPDYLNAARNGKKLIEERFERSPTQLHTHSPYCLNKEVLLEMEAQYPDLFKATGASRFRDITNLSIPSFLYHHYAYHLGKAYRKQDKTVLLKSDSANSSAKIRDILKLSSFSFCLNDGKASAEDERWHRTVCSLLDTMFPGPSPFERR